ncbi:MAG: hypothetical protein V3574_04240 [Candidatus Moraniibacteriota bacterium]
MLIENLIKTIHRQFSKDVTYPEKSSEELLVIVDHINDAIEEYENCVREGYFWPELKTVETDFVFGGTGEDNLPSDFLSFMGRFSRELGSCRPTIEIGGAIYEEVGANEGITRKQQGDNTSFVFWVEGGKVMTLPGANATMDLPYIKKHTRYSTGEETAEPEMANPMFIKDYALAKLFLDNEDDVLYQSYMTQAGERLKQMKYKSLNN